MKPCLVDVNVILALLARSHVHHGLARTWFDGLEAGNAGVCRIVQLGIVRLLGNPSVMGKDAVAAVIGWRVMAELLEDERVDFVSEPPGIDSILPSFLKYPVSAGKLVTDAYLASFARASDRRLVTLDGDFHRFRGIEVEVLAD
jgi:hypothetical protein